MVDVCFSACFCCSSSIPLLWSQYALDGSNSLYKKDILPRTPNWIAWLGCCGWWWWTQTFSKRFWSGYFDQVSRSYFQPNHFLLGLVVLYYYRWPLRVQHLKVQYDTSFPSCELACLCLCFLFQRLIIASISCIKVRVHTPNQLMPYNCEKLIQAIASNQADHAVFSDEDLSDAQVNQLADALKKTKTLKKLFFGDEVSWSNVMSASQQELFRASLAQPVASKNAN